MENSFDGVKHTAALLPSTSISTHVFKMNEYIYTQKYIFRTAQSSFIYYNPEWINKLWYIHTMKNYTTKANQMKYQNIFKERHNRKFTVWFHLHEVHQKEAIIYNDRNQNGQCLWEVSKNWTGYEDASSGASKFPNSILVVVGNVHL